MTDGKDSAPSTATASSGAAAAFAPAPSTPAGPSGLTRRLFLWSLPVGWTAFAAACASSLIASGRFLFPNVLFEPPQSFKAGFPSEYNVGEVDVRWKDAFGVWIVREPEGFYALIAVCTHLGCSPNWLPTENKFKCPCHGSGFYKSGVNFEGPAPRPLERARIVLADDGQLLVDKSVKFQQEKGEWEKAEAFLKA
jgi:cytochrome b6-f complex iron-sulfur subunit